MWCNFITCVCVCFPRVCVLGFWVGWSSKRRSSRGVTLWVCRRARALMTTWVGSWRRGTRCCARASTPTRTASSASSTGRSRRPWRGDLRPPQSGLTGPVTDSHTHHSPCSTGRLQRGTLMVARGLNEVNSQSDICSNCCNLWASYQVPDYGIRCQTVWMAFMECQEAKIIFLEECLCLQNVVVFCIFLCVTCRPVVNSTVCVLVKSALFSSLLFLHELQ